MVTKPKARPVELSPNKRATPNTIFMYLLSVGAQIESVTFRPHYDEESKLYEHSLVVVAGVPGSQFQYSIYESGATLMETCDRMLSSLKKKEWS